jgi:hypothetical protein
MFCFHDDALCYDSVVPLQYLALRALRRDLPQDLAEEVGTCTVGYSHA